MFGIADFLVGTWGCCWGVGGGVVSGREAGEAADFRGRARAWLASSAWTSLLGKGAAYLAGFVALAYVGSGGLSGLFSSSASTAQAGVASASAPIASSSPPVHATASPAPAASSGGSPTESVAPQHPAADAGAPVAPGDAGTGGAITADGKVILNLAGEEDLRRLPGIGPAKAKAILELRAKLKKFRRVEDLLRVKGLGRKKLARLRPLLVIDPP